MIDIQTGDVVVCVDNGPSWSHDLAIQSLLVVGRAYTVAAVLTWPNDPELGLLLKEVSPGPGYESFHSRRFRKVQRSDLSFKHWMKSLKPKEPARKFIADAQGAVSEG